MDWKARRFTHDRNQCNEDIDQISKKNRGKIMRLVKFKIKKGKSRGKILIPLRKRKIEEEL